MEWGKKGHKNGSKCGFGTVLGSISMIWEGFGTVWDLFWALLDAFWLFFWSSKLNFFQAWVQDELQEAFWMDFGWLWEGFGTVLGGLGEEFGRI